MRVRMRAVITGTRNGQDWPQIGGTLDLPDDEARHLCAAGLAVPIVEDRVETATAPAVEKRGPGRPRKASREG